MNSPKELNDYGDKYFYGLDGKIKNLETAFIYYKKAADLNNPVGFYNVAKYFIEKGSYKEAHDYLEKSKSLGYAKASIKLSNLYLEGKGYRRNKKKAFKYMESAVQNKSIEALALLGNLYEKGIGTKRDEEEARINYQLSANNKRADGMFCLGHLYLTSRHLKKDFEQGFFWLDKAAENGSIDAMNYLIDIYKQNHPYLKKKSAHYLDEIIFYYEELLAKTGNLEALEKVAFIYYEGNDIIKINNEKAYTYFNMLKEKDITIGYAGIGLLYMYGKYLETDYLLAKENLEVASTRNNPVAQNALGEMYRLGFGIPVNHNRAKDFYYEAAKNGDPSALINMGLLNYRNQINGANPNLAFEYINQALDKGSKLAYYWLGVFYEKGVGCEKDSKKAEEAFKQAIKHNNQGAKYKYAQMLFEQASNQKLNVKKQNQLYLQIKELLFNYINNSVTNEVNRMYALYLLGTLFSIKNFYEYSQKISRYYYEMSSEKGYSKAKVRMFFILKDKEPSRAFKYLTEATENPADGESYFVLANLYNEGSEFTERNIFKAKELYGKSAGMKYKPAKEKLTMI